MIKKIVSNTGPLIALAAAGQISLLNSLFDQVLVPETVRDEINVGGPHPIHFSEIAEQTCVIQTYSVALPKLMRELLDDGECATIQTAIETHADAVLIDERKARKIARQVYGLNVIGTIWVLLHAKQQGFLSNIATPLNQMRKNSYYFSENILDRALLEAGELQ